MAAVNVTFPGNLAQVKTANDLRSVPSTLLPLGALFLVNGLEGLFEYDPGSVAADDGKDVLRPYDKTPGQVGRWLRNVDGLATGPAGPTGPANSTYTSLTGLQAAAVSNRSYNFAPDTDDTSGFPASVYFYVPGDFSGSQYAADFTTGAKVELNAVPLTTGALVRDTDLVQPGVSTLANAIATTTTAGGGIARLDKGTFTGGVTLTSREVSLEGRGTSTTISPATPTGIGMRTTAQEASWKTPVIEGQNYEGTGTRQGTAFRFGTDSYTAGIEYTGRLERVNCRYENWDVCVDRPYGSIGDYADGTRYESANFHTKAIANLGTANGGQGDTMHPGCSYYMNEHRAGAMVASDYIDGKGVIGTCQIVRINPVDEGNPGHVYYWRDMSNRGGFPAPMILNAYNEANCTLPSVTTPDGVTAAPAWLFATNCDMIQLVNSTPGRITLKNSAVVTTGCDMTNAVGISGIDDDSSLIHHDVRCFAGKVPGLTCSVGQLQNLDGLNGPSFEMPTPQGLSPYAEGRSSGAYNAQIPETWGGSGANITTTTVVSDPGLPGLLYSQDITLPANSTYLPASFTIPTGYSVAFYRVRVVSGPGTSMRIDGNRGIGGTIPIDNAEWRTLVWAFYNSGAPITNEAFYHSTGGAATTLRIGGRGILTFNTLQEATVAINSGLFPAEQRPAYTVTNATPARTLNADSQLPAAGASYSQTAEQSMVDTLNNLSRVVATLVQDLRTKGVS